MTTPLSPAVATAAVLLPTTGNALALIHDDDDALEHWLETTGDALDAAHPNLPGTARVTAMVHLHPSARPGANNALVVHWNGDAVLLVGDDMQGLRDMRDAWGAQNGYALKDDPETLDLFAQDTANVWVPERLFPGGDRNQDALDGGACLAFPAATHTSPYRAVRLGDAPLSRAEVTGAQGEVPARVSVLVEVHLDALGSAEREDIQDRVSDGDQVILHDDGPYLNWDEEEHHTWIDALHEQAVGSDWHAGPCNPSWAVLGPSEGHGDCWVRYETDPFEG